MTKHTMSFFIHLYSGTLELGRLLAFPLATKMKRASQWNIQERCDVPHCKAATARRITVWIHAASLGESKLMVKFLGILRKKRPGCGYVLTAATRAGVDYLRGVLSDDIRAVGFFPLDTIRLMKKMLRVYAISRIWLMETELWPSMMLTCMQTGIPVGIANARIEEKSFISYWRLRLLCRPIFRHLDIVLAQNDAYATRFKRLGVRSDAVYVIGNLKGLVEINPVSPKRRQGLRDAMKIQKDDFILTAGCLHAGEGRILKETLDILRLSTLRIKCIVVPRHLDETGALIKELGPGALHLRETAASSPWEICIIDKMGVLEDMYALSAASFIGGTFVPIGGHNVWDAAQFAIPVFFGPDCHTQQESCELLLSTGVGFKVTSPHDLARSIIAASQIDPGAFASAISSLISRSRKRLEQIEELIP